MGHVIDQPSTSSASNKSPRYFFAGHESVGLRLTNMTAPSIQDPRHEMQLYCKFDMGGEDLYAVKWYKDDHEFYRYAPSGPTNYVQYPVPGVTVDTNRSHCTRDTCELWLVALQRPYSSGAYRCEVSSEAPAFRLASQTYNITVAGKNMMMWLISCVNWAFNKLRVRNQFAKT